MKTLLDSEPADIWSRWLLHGRHGGDASHERVLRAKVDLFADRVLDGLAIGPAMTLLDVGAGDGLVGFRAIDRIGPTLSVILNDISAALLRHAEIKAAERGVRSQCRFVEGSAENLLDVADSTVDCVTTRAVLAYVQDRRAALAEFMRVLKPGGTVSIAEPMFQDDAMNAIALRRIVDLDQPGEHRETMKLLHRWKSAQFPDTPEAMVKNPLVNYSERDLLELFQEAGFEEIHLELHIDIRQCDGIPWDTFLDSAPHPWASPLRQTLAERFSPSERIAFEQLVRISVESGVGNAIDRMVYLTARKPQR